METIKQIESVRPEWAKALIVAEDEHDNCDTQSDYFNTTVGRVVALAWSAHTKDLFSEMRKAAALMAETAHLGPGCSQWRTRVVLSEEIPFENAGCGGYFKGSPSHWHGEFTERVKVFTTRDQAAAYIASQPQPEPISFKGFPATFEWEITEEKIEHREKYSMGHGYYLKAGHRYGSGWVVRKQSYQIPDVVGDPGNVVAFRRPA